MHLFTTKQNKLVSLSIAVPNGNASRKFNLANDSVLFRFDLSLGLKGDDFIKNVTWANCFNSFHLERPNLLIIKSHKWLLLLLLLLLSLNYIVFG